MGSHRGPARVTVMVVVMLALAGCGYQLRGARNLDVGLERVYLEQGRSRGPDQLEYELRRALTYAGVGLTRDRDSADAVVTVHRENYDRRVLSVDPETGKVREFEMAYETRFSVHRPDGTVLVEDQRITLERDYIFDETAVLGTFQQESALERDLREDAAQAILRRMSTLEYD